MVVRKCHSRTNVQKFNRGMIKRLACFENTAKLSTQFLTHHLKATVGSREHPAVCIADSCQQQKGVVACKESQG